MTLITDSTTLEKFCDDLSDEPFITVDTEFMREKTYWPQLCLVQIGGSKTAAVIDALAQNMDLSPLFKLFDKPKIIKVFHAARQDLEIFLHLNGRLPAPLFDTQVAAMVCGFGESVGYEQLVAKLADARLDKGSRFTDWSARPLSARQISYALADVTHLRVAYQKLSIRLEQENRTNWIEEELEILRTPQTYMPDPMKAYQRIKGKKGNGKFLVILRELAAWREREAQHRNVPRNRILRDEALIEIAHHVPLQPRALSRTRGLSENAANGSLGLAIIETVNQALEIPVENWPQLPPRLSLPSGTGPVTDLLKVFLKKVSDDFDVAGRLIASSADLEQIAGFGEDAKVSALQGWRREIFGSDALRLCNGKLALSIINKKLTVQESSN